MRKLQRTHSQAKVKTKGRKGRKLKGLTPSEAHERSQKGWVTKHRKYKYGADEPDKIEDPTLGATHQRDPAYEQAMVEHYAKSSRNIEAGDVESHGQTQSFKHYLRNQPRSVQQDFLQRVKKQREVEALRKQRGQKAEALIRPPEEESGEHAARLKKINESGTVEPSDYENDHIAINATRSVKKQVNYEPEITPRGPDLAQSSDTTYKLVQAAFSVIPPGETRARVLASTADVSRLTAAVHLSKTANSVEKRRASAREADKMINRMAGEAQRRHDQMQEENDIRSLAKELDIIPQTRTERPSVKEKRLANAVTPTDLYKTSGHAERGFHNALKQVGFMKSQSANRLGKFKETEDGPQKAHITRYFNKGGITNKTSGVVGVTPNKQWQYKLRRGPDEVTLINPHRIEKGEDLPSVDLRPDETRADFHRRLSDSGLTDDQKEAVWNAQQSQMFTEKLDFDDVSRAERNTGQSRFHVGRRDAKGNLGPGEWDQVLSERLVNKYSGPKRTNFELGKRGQSHEGELPKGVQEMRYVEKDGITSPTKGPQYVAAKREVEPEYQVKTPRDGWQPVHKSVYDLVPAEERRQSYREKKIQVMYVPKGSNKLLRGQKDVFNVRTPQAKAGNLQVGEHLFQVRADESGRSGQALRVLGAPARARDTRRKQEVETVLEGSDSSGTMKRASDVDDRDLVNKMKANQSFKNDVKNELMVRNAGMTDEDAEGHIKELLAAGGTALAFSSKRRLREGYIPAVINKAVSPFGVTAMDVNDAYVRPLYEHAANAKYSVKHPFSSPSGELGGVQFSSVRYRKHLILPDKRYARALEYRGSQLDRMANTLEAAQTAHGRTGIRGAIARHMSESALRTKQYGHFDGVLDNAIKESSDAKEMSQPFIRTREGDYVKGIGAHRETQIAAQNLNKKAKIMQVAQAGKKVDLGPKGKVFPKAARWSGGEFTGGEKGLLIAGAAVAATTGGYYLYHRHQQKNMEESDKVAFYNKILPRKFTSPVATPGRPQVTRRLRVPSTGLTDELMVSGNRIPARVFVPMSKKSIALRPMDRGYGKNSSIGRPSVSLTGEATHTGKARDALLVDMEQASKSGRKRPGRSQKQSLSVLGKKTPFYASFGKRSPVQLSGSNPNRMTQADIDQVMWAHSDIHGEVPAEIKNFYNLAGRDTSRYTPREVQKLQYDYGSREMREFAAKAERPFTPTKSFVGAEESPLIVTPGQVAKRDYLIGDLMRAKNSKDTTAIESAQEMLSAFDKGQGR